MVRTIKFYGAMRKKYGPSFKFAAENWTQVLGGLVSAFGPQIREEIRAGAWHLIDGPKRAGNDIGDFLNRQDGQGLPQESPTFRFLHGIASFPKPLLAAVAGAVGFVSGAFGVSAARAVTEKARNSRSVFMGSEAAGEASA